ncbi:hypothetical protein BHM03_00020492, partial [Ensete ventricosum]
DDCPCPPTATPVGGRTSRGWQPLAGALQPAPFAGVALQAGVPTGDCRPCGLHQPPLGAGPGRGLTVDGWPRMGAGCPSSSLPSLRKCNKNA